MTDSMAHRGPQDGSHWLNMSGNVAFGHRRLSIVDLADEANQPMFAYEPGAEGGDRSALAVLVFNGEIYNHRQLRQELEQSGARFRTAHSDSEILLQGYLHWGLDDLLTRIRGIFAFAIHDVRQHKTYLVRDHCGVKPLYLATRNGRLVFASDVRAIAGIPGFQPDLNDAVVAHYLSYLSVAAPLTMYKGVYKLPAGTVLEVDSRSLACQSHRYWHAANADQSAWYRKGLETRDADKAASVVKKLLVEAVCEQVEADVPVGLFLSGGIDSSALLAIAKMEAGKALESFSIRYAEPGYHDESGDAATFARKMKAPHHVIDMRVDDAFAQWPSVVEAQEDPVADWVCLPVKTLSAAAHQAGLRTVLVGEGADEPFFGYNHYFSALKRMKGLGQNRLGQNMSPTMNGLFQRLGAAGSRYSAGIEARFDFLQRYLGRQPLFLSGAVGFAPLAARRLTASSQETSLTWIGIENDLKALGLADGFYDGGNPAATAAQCYQALDALGVDQDMPRRMMLRELDHRLPELLLMRVDKMSMAHSIEARVPFMDHRLIGFMAGLTADIRLAGSSGGAITKPVLKKALADYLPNDLLTRPKTGFGTPMARWLATDQGREEINYMLDSPLLNQGVIDKTSVLRLVKAHLQHGKDCSQMLWAIIHLARWQQNLSGLRQ